MRLNRQAAATAILGLLVMVSCSGGGQGAAPQFNMPSPPPTVVPTLTPTPQPTPTMVVLGYGAIDGQDNQFSPIDGDTATGGQGAPIDGIACDQLASPYHVHAHISVIVNGRRTAIPDTVGIFHPGPEVHGRTETGQCFYHLHTHDADNLIHVENATVFAFTVGQLFDIWGQPLNSGNIGGFTGTTLVYTATPPPHSLIASNFVQYTGDPRSIVFSSHEEIVLEVGPPFLIPPYLPPVVFYTQF